VIRSTQVIPPKATAWISTAAAATTVLLAADAGLVDELQGRIQIVAAVERTNNRAKRDVGEVVHLEGRQREKSGPLFLFRSEEVPISPPDKFP
jgi:hypothetical protein